MQLVSERFLVREFTAADAPSYGQYLADPRYLEFYGPEVAVSGHAAELVRSFIARASEHPRRDFALAVTDRATDDLIGCCSLRTVRQPGPAEFGIELARQRWGRGLAYEASRAHLAWGLVERSVQTVTAEPVGENQGFGRLLGRLGFTVVRRRPGADWMASRGWTYLEWRLQRSAWTGGSCT